LEAGSGPTFFWNLDPDPREREKLDMDATQHLTQNAGLKRQKMEPCRGVDANNGGVEA
jgi:hypothetical protein